jgi:hypothetical protein
MYVDVKEKNSNISREGRASVFHSLASQITQLLHNPPDPPVLSKTLFATDETGLNLVSPLFFFFLLFSFVFKLFHRKDKRE